MRVLMVHNAYQQRGGEDVVFESEMELLENHSHEVYTYHVSNKAVPDRSKLRLASETVWSSGSKRAIQKLLVEVRPEVAHFHNTFPLISPSAYAACKEEGVPVVQTLHNYRLLCPNGLFFRDGGVCEDCVGKAVPWPGVVHACYRGSRAATGATAAMLTAHRILGTWNERVDAYVALTEFARQKFIEGGLPAQRLHVKPNFVHPDPGPGNGGGGYALFVGRLSVEKGIGTLLSSWERLGGRIPLKIVGDGPLALRVAEATKRLPEVDWLGALPAEKLHRLMGEASMLIFPSEWYETFGRVTVEAFAKGTPVAAARTGAMAELVDHGRTGLHFRPGDPEDLAAQVERALSHPTELAEMRREARAEFETRYTAEENYRRLIEIYESAVAGAGALA